jgi:NACHT conflict system protein
MAQNNKFVEFFLAAYASRYQVISNGMKNVVIEAAQFHRDIINDRIESYFSRMSRMHILFLFQYLMRENYSYNFFKNAIEEAALKIALEETDNELKSYALFFLDVIAIEIGSAESFGFLLRDNASNLPIDISMALRHESENSKGRTLLLKKQDKRIRLMLRDKSLANKVREMYERPIKALQGK